MTKKAETYSYKGWLISDSFIKRSLASVGYHFMGGIFIWLSLITLGLAIGALVWIFKSLF